MLSPRRCAADEDSGALVACGTLLLERKFIRGAGIAGHIEDVVVDASQRGTGTGKKLIAALVARAREAGCYQVRPHASSSARGGRGAASSLRSLR